MRYLYGETIMSEKELRSKVIRLAHSKPELRGHLLPLVKSAGGGTSWLDYTKTWFESLGKQVIKFSAKKVTYKNVSSKSVFFRIQGHKEMAWLLHKQDRFIFSMKGLKAEKMYGETISLDYIAKQIASYIDQTEEL